MENLKTKIYSWIYYNFGKLVIILIVIYLFLIGIVVVRGVFDRQPIIAKQDSLKVFIKQKELQIDTIVKTKEKIIIKNKTIIIKLKHEDSVITNTPDSNITKLFSELSKKLDTTSSK